MKVRVIKPFKDKYTKVIYQEGHEIEVTEERYKELTSAALGPFIEVIKQPKPPPTNTTKEGKKPTTKKSTKKSR